MEANYFDKFKNYKSFLGQKEILKPIPIDSNETILSIQFTEDNSVFTQFEFNNQLYSKKEGFKIKRDIPFGLVNPNYYFQQIYFKQKGFQIATSENIYQFKIMRPIDKLLNILVYLMQEQKLDRIFIDDPQNTILIEFINESNFSEFLAMCIQILCQKGSYYLLSNNYLNQILKNSAINQEFGEVKIDGIDGENYAYQKINNMKYERINNILKNLILQFMTICDDQKNNSKSVLNQS